ncbi:MAG: hypothetical protein R2777_02115 [Chitinophagales bacterium]
MAHFIIQAILSQCANYKEGYGPTSQDVLIPAFLVAYQGKDAKKSKIKSI